MTTKTIVHDLLNTTLPRILGQQVPFQWAMNQETTPAHLHLTLPIPSAGIKANLLRTLSEVFTKEIPHIAMTITLDHCILSHATQMPGKRLRGVKNTIAIASGKGGVGKSTVTVNLAIALANAGARVGVLDADIYGPSIPLMLGTVAPIEIKEDRYLPATKYGIQAMSIGYLMQGKQPLIWRGPMLAKSLIQMLDITLWDNLDYLFIDLPPGTGDIQLSLVQKIPLTGAIVVTTPQQVATLDAEKALKMFRTTNIDVLGVVENMALHTCTHCQHQEAIFQGMGARNLCQQHQCPLLGELPLDKRISSHCDEGMPSSAQPDHDLKDLFGKIAQNMAIELARKPID